MTQLGSIHQLNVSNGGVPKRPVPEASVRLHGMEGDAHVSASHQGPDRALCLYSVEVIEALRDDGHNVFPGSTGENITVSGLEWKRIVPGARLRLGDEVLIEVSSYTSPCWKNAHWFADGDVDHMSQQSNPGRSRVCARVLEEGRVRTGDPVELIEESAATRAWRQQPRTIRWESPAP